MTTMLLRGEPLTSQQVMRPMSDLGAELAWLARVNAKRHGAYDICRHAGELPAAMTTLIERGYAVWRSRPAGVWITRRGQYRVCPKN